VILSEIVFISFAQARRQILAFASLHREREARACIGGGGGGSGTKHPVGFRGKAHGQGWSPREAWLLFSRSLKAKPKDILQLFCKPTSDKQGSAVADKPARRAASRRTCCKQIRWTLNVAQCDKLAIELSWQRVQSRQFAATSAAFNLSRLHLAPSLWWPRLSFAEILRAEVPGLSCDVVCVTFSRFQRTLTYLWQTNRQTHDDS